MRYRNTKTGAIIDSLCVISGGDWIREGENGEILDTPVDKVIKPKPTRKRR